MALTQETIKAIRTNESLHLSLSQAKGCKISSVAYGIRFNYQWLSKSPYIELIAEALGKEVKECVE
jgi:hypothetical protein